MIGKWFLWLMMAFSMGAAAYFWLFGNNAAAWVWFCYALSYLGWLAL